MTRISRSVLGGFAAAIALSVTAPLTAQESSGQGSGTVVEDGGAHFVGNPDAELTLTEYVSYTCSHCAHFAADGDPALKLAYIPSGKLRVEYQSFLRNPVDAAASLLTRCGEPWRFPANHHKFMHNQPEWLGKAQKASQSQVQRWGTGPLPERMRAIASDLDFYELMETLGYKRTEVDKCLADEAAVQMLADQTQAAVAIGVQGTPSFALNGSVLDGVHAWAMLQPHLDTALSEPTNP
ncbi:DsbA family protein [Altererythrobacter sp. MF3-039]|uniref:DsbA family protein n=1 Tax=Altererythrobacter sp. MF3-039 TaxID=3252901 RepID=UPI00390C8942